MSELQGLIQDVVYEIARVARLSAHFPDNDVDEVGLEEALTALVEKLLEAHYG